MDKVTLFLCVITAIKKNIFFIGIYMITGFRSNIHILFSFENLKIFVIQRTLPGTCIKILCIRETQILCKFLALRIFSDSFIY